MRASLCDAVVARGAGAAFLRWSDDQPVVQGRQASARLHFARVSSDLAGDGRCVAGTVQLPPRKEKMDAWTLVCRDRQKTRHSSAACYRLRRAAAARLIIDCLPGMAPTRARLSRFAGICSAPPVTATRSMAFASNLVPWSGSVSLLLAHRIFFRALLSVRNISSIPN